MLSLLISSLRPHHWLKNGFVYLPIFFAARFDDSNAWGQTTLVFALFCMAASATYIVNDLLDRGADRHHPTKRLRPIASGKVTVTVALATAIALFALALGGGCVMSPIVGAILAGYIALHLTYSYALKHIVIVDLLAIAIGFNLRVAAGGVAAGVIISPWLTALTFLVALLLATGKRRQELVAIGNNAARKVLDAYNLAFVDRAINLLLATIFAAYLIYSFQPEHPAAFMYSVVPATYGLLRYAWLLGTNITVEGPTELLLADRPLQLAGLAWALIVFIALAY